jgi:DNA-binding transcriptional LysR family regulator
MDQIGNFIKTADTLNITKAADEMYITQSVLSKQIAGMERELGAVLFDRNSSGIRLTPAGLVAYEMLSKTLRSYEDAIHHIREYQAHIEGTLRFAKLSGLKRPCALVDALDDFSRFYPAIIVLQKNQDNSAMARSLREGKYDIYLTWKHEVDNSAEIECIPLVKYRVCLAISAAHPLAGLQNPPIEMFRGMSWITVVEEESYSFNRFIASVIRNAGFEPSLIYADNFADMLDLIHDEAGVGIVSEGHSIHGTSSIQFFDFPEIPSWTMSIVHRKDNKNPLTKDFLSTLLKRVTETTS